MSDHDQPVRVAFCRLLHVANGGRLTEGGVPILQEGVRGKCDIAFDCGNCSLLQAWQAGAAEQGFVQTWECQTCLRNTERAAWRYLPGYYHEGHCQRCDFETPLLQLTVRREVLPPHPWPFEEDPTK